MTNLNENLVIVRAKHNFSNNGCGNRMWDASTDDASTFKIDQALYLTDGEREKFIEQARDELTRELDDGGSERRHEEASSREAEKPWG